MAIKAGLVGVNPKGVDKNGMPIGSGGANVEAEIQQINLDIAQLQASKVGIGQLTANNKAFNFAYDSTTEKYGYKLDGTGDFIPFESAGGGPGWVKPAELTTEGLTYTNLEYVSGGYYIDNGICYIDICLKSTSSSGNKYLKGLQSKVATDSLYIQIYGAATSDVANQYIINGTTSLKYILDSENLPSNVDKYMHLFGMCTAV